MTIRSFSGTHQFRRECAVTSVELDWIDQDVGDLSRLAATHADRVAEMLESGRCPRCEDALDPHDTAGSRVTLCRCIPICPACGADEAFQPALGRPVSRVWQWPIGKGARTRRRNRAMESATPAVLDGRHVLSEEGVSEVEVRKHPGGWAEYGHDDEVQR